MVDNSKDKYEMGYAFSDCNYSNISRRISSAGWSEINTPEEDNKSIDMDTISSCTTSRSDFYTQDFVLPDQPHFCLSPLSPFRFALHRSPSVGRRTPEFLSPSASPCHHRTQEDGDQATGNLQNQTQEEDEKDQCSPVSVLDLPFADDVREDGREDEEEEYEDEDDYDLECSYALMQKAKFQLLEKLRRFERLAELEPIELEKRMLEGYEDDDDYYQDENEEHEVVDEFGMNADDLICNILSVSSPCNLEKIPGHTKRLVSDLVAEEKKNRMDNKNEAMVKIVCKRLDSWKEVESNTIDMMVELDLIKELDGWKSYDEEVGARAKEIELAIFGVLIEEISEELVSH